MTAANFSPTDIKNLAASPHSDEGLLDIIDRLYASDFLSTNADGSVVNKQQWMEMLKAGLFPVDKVASDDFHLRRYGDTALITGRSTYFKDGRKVWEVRHTQVWVKLDDRWQLVSWQGTPLPSEA